MMKKTISVLLAAVLCFGCLWTAAGCTGDEPIQPVQPQPAEPEVLPETLAGGWGSAMLSGSEIPSDAKEAFDKATADLLGASYEPVAYLGSQVVAGINYSYLCTVSAVTENPVAKLCKVIVYKDLEGGATVTETIDVALSDYVGSSATELDLGDAALCGGWNPNTETEAVLPESAQAAFDKVSGGLSGMECKPLALLGSQVVAGANYAVLVSVSADAEEPSSALAVMVIYADLEGGATVTSITGFPVH